MYAMNPRVQRLCVWSGPVGLGVFFIGLIVASWFPPPSPHQTALQVAHMYISHATGIRLGCLLIAAGGALTAPYVAVISAQMKRMEGDGGPLHSIQLGCGMLGVLLFTIPTFMWQGAAYFPHRNPQITQALHDIGWIAVIAAIFPALIQNASIAIAVFTDKRAEPVFPRWIGYMNIWVATLFLPSGMVLFFHHGPFSWNGIFTFWLAATVFGAWFILMVIYMLKAINKQAAEEAAAGGALRAAAAPAPAPVTA
jgi:hypothetical protein